MANNWENYLPVEGFLVLERFQGEVISASFVVGEFATQLELNFRVDAVDGGEAPPATYKQWYGLGKNASQQWQIVNDGADIWNADEKASWTKSSNFGKLILQMMDIDAPKYLSGPPTHADSWVGLNAIWENEIIENVGLPPSNLALPKQLLMAGVTAPTPAAPAAVPAPVAAAVPAVNGSAPAPPPPPAAPAMTLTVINHDERWASNAETWRKYVKSIAQGKSVAVASEAMLRDGNIAGDSVVQASIEDGTFWIWAEQADFLKVVDGILV